jgi:hypothetical protein
MEPSSRSHFLQRLVWQLPPNQWQKGRARGAIVFAVSSLSYVAHM